MTRALLIANDALATGGYVEDELVGRGFRFARLRREDASAWPELEGVELVLVLGSEWHVHDADIAAWVASEAALVGEAHGRGIPVFGICYGAQILSHALGGVVHRADHPEIGWFPVDPLDASISAGPWFQWHADTFTLPSGATLLAESAVGPQAFRLGRSLGVQFHPEVDVDTIESWVAADGGRELGAAGVDAEALVACTRLETRRSEPAARALVEWFCGQMWSTARTGP